MTSLKSFLGGFSLSILVGTIILFNMTSLPGRTKEALAVPKDKAKHTAYLDRVQLDCMAQNIFFEARGENAAGKAMVGMVVMERTTSPHFPQTICGVVYQAERDEVGRIIRNRCQFSWYCDGKEHTIDFQDDGVAREWEESYLIAQLVMLGRIRERIDMEGVTHYHNKTVKPFWSKDKNYTLVAHIGDHLFYRWSKAMLPRWQPALAMN